MINFFVQRFHVNGIKNYSVGAVYASVADFPRGLVYKQRMTSCLCIIPEPKEPSLTLMNEIVHPIMENIKVRTEQVIKMSTQRTD